MKAKFNFALAGVTALTLAGAAPAFAADAIYEQPPEPAPVEIVPSASTGWAGAYAGVQGGYDWGRTDSNLPGVGSRDHEGWVGGAFAGVQGQNGSIVYGVEGDVGYNGADGVANGLSTKGGAEGSLRARLGYAVNDRVLLYGTGGGAAASLKASDGVDSERKTMLGYTVGAGAEAKVTENVFVRGEYRFTDYGRENFNLGGVAHGVDAQSNKVQLGLGIKF